MHKGSRGRASTRTFSSKSQKPHSDQSTLLPSQQQSNPSTTSSFSISHKQLESLQSVKRLGKNVTTKRIRKFQSLHARSSSLLAKRDDLLAPQQRYLGGAPTHTLYRSAIISPTFQTVLLHGNTDPSDQDIETMFEECYDIAYNLSVIPQHHHSQYQSVHNLPDKFYFEKPILTTSTLPHSPSTQTTHTQSIFTTSSTKQVSPLSAPLKPQTTKLQHEKQRLKAQLQQQQQNLTALNPRLTHLSNAELIQLSPTGIARTLQFTQQFTTIQLQITKLKAQHKMYLAKYKFILTDPRSYLHFTSIKAQHEQNIQLYQQELEQLEMQLSKCVGKSGLFSKFSHLMPFSSKRSRQALIAQQRKSAYQRNQQLKHEFLLKQQKKQQRHQKLADKLNYVEQKFSEYNTLPSPNLNDADFHKLPSYFDITKQPSDFHPKHPEHNMHRAQHYSLQDKDRSITPYQSSSKLPRRKQASKPTQLSSETSHQLIPYSPPSSLPSHPSSQLIQQSNQLTTTSFLSSEPLHQPFPQPVQNKSVYTIAKRFQPKSFIKGWHGYSAAQDLWDENFIEGLPSRWMQGLTDSPRNQDWLEKNYQPFYLMHKSFLQSIPHVYVNFWVKWAALWQLPPIPFAVPPPPFFLLPSEYKKWFFATWRWSFKIYFTILRFAFRPLYYFVPRNLLKEGVSKDMMFSLPKDTHPAEREYLVKLDKAQLTKRSKWKSRLIYHHSSEYVVPLIKLLPGKRPWLFFWMMISTMGSIFNNWQHALRVVGVPGDMRLDQVKIDFNRDTFTHLVEQFTMIEDMFEAYTIRPEDFTWVDSIYASLSHVELDHYIANAALLIAFGPKVYRFLGPIGFSVLWTFSAYGAYTANAYAQRWQGRTWSISFLEQVIMSQPDTFSPSEVAHIQDVIYRPALGASGAIAGVLTALACLFPKDKIKILGAPLPIPILVSTMIFAEGLALHNQLVDGIDHSGHLGGVLGGIAGLVVLWYLPFLGKNTPFIKYGTNLPIVDWIRGRPRMKPGEEEMYHFKRWQPEEGYHQQLIELYSNMSWRGYLHDPTKIWSVSNLAKSDDKRLKHMWSSHYQNSGHQVMVNTYQKEHVKNQLGSVLADKLPNIITTHKRGPIIRMGPHRRTYLPTMQEINHQKNVQQRSVQRLIFNQRSYAALVREQHWNSFSNIRILHDPAPELVQNMKELRNPKLTDYYDTFGEAHYDTEMVEKVDAAQKENISKLESLGLLNDINREHYTKLNKNLSPDEFIQWERKRLEDERDNEAKQSRDRFMNAIQVIQKNLYTRAYDNDQKHLSKTVRVGLKARTLYLNIFSALESSTTRLSNKIARRGALYGDYLFIKFQSRISASPKLMKWLPFYSKFVANRRTKQIARLEHQLRKRNPFVVDQDVEYIKQQQSMGNPNNINPYAIPSEFTSISNYSLNSLNKSPLSTMAQQFSQHMDSNSSLSTLAFIKNRQQLALQHSSKNTLPEWYQEFDFLSPPIIYDEQGRFLVQEDSQIKEFPYQVYVLHKIQPPPPPDFEDMNSKELTKLFRDELEDREVFQKSLEEYDRGYLSAPMLQSIAQKVKEKDFARKDRIVELKAQSQQRLLSDEKMRKAHIHSNYLTELENVEKYVQDHRVRLQEEKEHVIEEVKGMWLELPQNKIEARLTECFHNQSASEDDVNRGRRLLNKLLKLDPTKGFMPLFNTFEVKVKPIPGQDIIDPYQLFLDLQINGPYFYDKQPLTTARLATTAIEIKFPISNHNRRLFFPQTREEAFRNRYEILKRCPDYFDKRAELLQRQRSVHKLADEYDTSETLWDKFLNVGKTPPSKGLKDLKSLREPTLLTDYKPGVMNPDYEIDYTPSLTNITPKRLDEEKEMPQLAWETPEYKQKRMVTNDLIRIQRRKREQFEAYTKEKHEQESAKQLQLSDKLTWKKYKNASAKELATYFLHHTSRIYQRITTPPEFVIKLLEKSPWLRTELFEAEIQKKKETHREELISQGYDPDKYPELLLQPHERIDKIENRRFIGLNMNTMPGEVDASTVVARNHTPTLFTPQGNGFLPNYTLDENGKPLAHYGGTEQNPDFYQKASTTLEKVSLRTTTKALSVFTDLGLISTSEAGIDGMIASKDKTPGDRRKTQRQYWNAIGFYDSATNPFITRTYITDTGKVINEPVRQDMIEGYQQIKANINIMREEFGQNIATRRRNIIATTLHSPPPTMTETSSSEALQDDTNNDELNDDDDDDDDENVEHDENGEEKPKKPKKPKKPTPADHSFLHQVVSPLYIDQHLRTSVSSSFKDKFSNINRPSDPLSISSYSQQRLTAKNLTLKNTRHRRFSTRIHRFDDQAAPPDPLYSAQVIIPRAALHFIENQYLPSLSISSFPSPTTIIPLHSSPTSLSPHLKLSPQKRKEKWKAFKPKLYTFLSNPSTLLSLCHPLFAAQAIEHIRNTPKYSSPISLK